MGSPSPSAKETREKIDRLWREWGGAGAGKQQCSRRKIMRINTVSYMLCKILDLPFDYLKIRLGWRLNQCTSIVPCGGPRT